MQWRFDYFRKRCGDCEVDVQFGRESDANYETNQPKLKRMMRFADYVDLVERSGPTNDFYMTANNTSHNRTIAQSHGARRVVVRCTGYRRISRRRIARYRFFLDGTGWNKDAVSP